MVPSMVPVPANCARAAPGVIMAITSSATQLHAAMHIMRALEPRDWNRLQKANRLICDASTKSHLLLRDVAI